MSTPLVVPPGPITLDQVVKQICAAGKKVSRRQVQRYFGRLGIASLGAGQKPSVYPSDAGIRVLQWLGFVPEVRAQDGRVVTMTKLKAERAKARGTR